ncbi:MAG: SAM-dependent methyltransferase, partial [Luminiphilus sp.]
ISVPRSWPERVCWSLCDAYRRTPGGHIRIFNASHLSREVERYTLTETRRHGAHALHVPYWWLKCLFWHTENEPFILKWYHRLLVWDLMKRPWLTRAIEAVTNPWMGKSVVLYFDRLETH